VRSDKLYSSEELASNVCNNYNQYEAKGARKSEQLTNVQMRAYSHLNILLIILMHSAGQTAFMRFK
jgi:hypothetical protein